MSDDQEFSGVHQIEPVVLEETTDDPTGIIPDDHCAGELDPEDEQDVIRTTKEDDQ